MPTSLLETPSVTVRAMAAGLTMFQYAQVSHTMQSVVQYIQFYETSSFVYAGHSSNTVTVIVVPIVFGTLCIIIIVVVIITTCTRRFMTLYKRRINNTRGLYRT